jgi:DNA polymerase-3 subunit gamma/tau
VISSQPPEAASKAVEKPAAQPAPPAPESKPAAGSTPPAQAAPGQKLELVVFQQAWPKVMQIAKGYRIHLGALLNSCTLLAIKEGALVLGFNSDLLKNKMEAEDNLRLCRQAIQKATGLNPIVLCTVLGSKSNPGDHDVDGDGIVGTALNMGGQIVQKGKTEK